MPTGRVNRPKDFDADREIEKIFQENTRNEKSIS